MALTSSRIKDAFDVWGKHYVETWEFTGDTSYPAGGYAIAASDVGLKKIWGAEFIGGNPAAGALKPHWDSVNNKLMFFYPTGGGNASPAALADPAGTIANATIPAGATAVTSTAANGAIVTVPNPALTPGKAKEVAAATDLSTIIVRMRFVGI